ncbi:MAG: asparagine synthase-related protein [Actinomycetota bacterium]|nr:asparagine synthase-related protein [Actinomycetota bacterium]
MIDYTRVPELNRDDVIAHLVRRDTPELLMSFTDLDTRRVDVAGGTWFTVGLDSNQLDQLARGGSDPAIADRLVRAQRDAMIVLVAVESEGPVSVGAWKGLLAGRDIFFAVLDSGSVIVSDHFRNVISFVPPGKRAPGDDALLEHYLCGWVYDRGTYSDAVDRIAAGDRLHIDLRSGDVSIELIDRMMTSSDAGALPGAIEGVEAALEEIMAPLRDDPDVSMTFSGGVDSTLLATFLDDRAPLVTMTTDTPEFHGETEYALAAARLLNRKLTPAPLVESNYEAMLNDSIDRMATPAQHYVTPLLAALYLRPETTYILGEGADSVFGSGRGMQRVSGAMASAPARAALGLLQHIPGTIGGRSSQILAYATRYAQPRDSTEGQTGRALTFGDTSLVESIVGEAAVNRVLESHMEVIRQRVEMEAPASHRFLSHLEMIQWRNTLGDLATVDRLLANASGKRVVMPFTSPRVVSELARVPVAQRYIKGLAGKWMLKEILSKRVPGYAVNQRKYATGLPFERYYQSGPLSGIWDRYDVPEFISPAIRASVVAKPTAMTWNAITHAIWSERIERNANLRPLPAVLDYREALSTPSG